MKKPRLLSLENVLTRVDQLIGKEVRVRGWWGNDQGIYDSLNASESDDHSKALRAQAPRGKKLKCRRPRLLYSLKEEYEEDIDQDVCQNNECEVIGTLGKGKGKFAGTLLNVSYLRIETPVDPRKCGGCGEMIDRTKKRLGRRDVRRLCPLCGHIVAIRMSRT